ncbi:uncharacterized protein LOC128224580 [Mya arenaria]|uniref:uncharacterized protein LOC128224580 n=1 Tax=Mya arenaria TaxID=6604 RepID=UPI0022E15372|nr:uncharacterized protein LOC128224580 [Mya arenaria]
MFVMEDSVMDFDVDQENVENTSRDSTFFGKVLARMCSAHQTLPEDRGSYIENPNDSYEANPNDSYELFPYITLLLHLFLPLCSLSVAISSLVLPYWAFGETDDVAVGLFKCCNFTEDNRSSNHSECSSLSDCFPSDFKLHSVFNAAAGLQITYIALHGITFILTAIGLKKGNFSVCRIYSGFVIVLAAAISYIGIIVYFSGIITSENITGKSKPRLSINLAIISLAVYLSYAAVCFRQPKALIIVLMSTCVIYNVIFVMTQTITFFIIIGYVAIGMALISIVIVASFMTCI